MNNPMIKFGIGQILNPTPEQAKKAFAVFFKATATLALVAQCIPQIPKHVADTINMIVVDSNALAYGFTRLWGIDVNAVPPPSK